MTSNSWDIVLEEDPKKDGKVGKGGKRNIFIVFMDFIIFDKPRSATEQFSQRSLSPLSRAGWCVARQPRSKRPPRILG